LDNAKYIFNDEAIPAINIDDYIVESERCACGGSLLKLETDGILVCEKCAVITPFLLDTSEDLFEKKHTDVLAYCYKRLNHYKEVINQIQGKELTNMPELVIIKMKELIVKERLELKDLTILKTRKMLKDLKFNKFYEHLSLIRSRLGIPPPLFSRELESRLINLFNLIQAPFNKHVPDGRINFLNYYYVLYKLCELIGETTYLEYFPMLKDHKKIKDQDAIWAKICEELNWVFMPTN
tara:strand:+ start:915 stop:1628 length:714 start_codon:yes stop_codon:yes gene_type:complete